MYSIKKFTDHLRVDFQTDFDYNTIKMIIHHEMMIEEYPFTNDIWLVGKHRADIRLAELEAIVAQFHAECPKKTTRTKTAMVAEPGLTQAILELWINAVRRRMPFEMQVFNTLEEAEAWLGIAKVKVA